MEQFLAAFAERAGTPLHEAVKTSEESTLRTLIRKFDVNKTDERGRTALHNAAEAPDGTATDLLLQNGAFTSRNAKDSLGQTPLHRAAIHNNIEAAKILVKYKADCNATDKRDKTPLHYACTNRGAEIVSLMLDGGADVNAREQRSGLTALFYACWHGCENGAELLLARGSPAKQERTDGKVFKFATHTPLHAAADNNYPSICEKLLRSDPLIINVCDNQGRTALHWAAHRGYTNVVNVLRDHGADHGVRDADGCTAADLASARGHDELARTLL